MIILLLLRYPILSLYNVSEIVKNQAAILIIFTAISMPVKYANFTNLMGILRAGGDAHYVLALEVIPLWVIAVPLTVLGGLYWGVGALIVYLLAQSEEFIKCIFGIQRFLTKKWIKNVTIDISNEEELLIDN